MAINQACRLENRPREQNFATGQGRMKKFWQESQSAQKKSRHLQNVGTNASSERIGKESAEACDIKQTCLRSCNEITIEIFSDSLGGNISHILTEDIVKSLLLAFFTNFV